MSMKKRREILLDALTEEQMRYLYRLAVKIIFPKNGQPPVR